MKTKEPKLNKKGAKLYRSFQKFLLVYVKATELCVLYGLIYATPAKEIKRMKLRQLEREIADIIYKGFNKVKED